MSADFMEYSIVADEFEKVMNDFLMEVGKARAISDQAKQSQKDMEQAQGLHTKYELVSLLFQNISEQQQAVLIEKIERLVSLGLRSVF